MQATAQGQTQGEERGFNVLDMSLVFLSFPGGFQKNRFMAQSKIVFGREARAGLHQAFGYP